MGESVEYNALFNQLSSFLQITEEETRLLASSRETLTRSASNFGEIFYDYLFRFPPTADKLHEYRQQGGNIQCLAGKQVAHLLNLLNTDNSGQTQASKAGRIHYDRSIDPVWILSAYRLYIDHLSQITLTHPDIPETARQPLINALLKVIFRDMGIMLDGYWQAATDELREEKSRSDNLQQQITNLLSNIPQVLWSIDVVTGQPIYISPGIREVSPIDVEFPIPCLVWTIPEDRDEVILAWEQALSGHPAQVESRIFGQDDTLRWFRRTFHPYQDNEGKVVRIDGIMEEITDYKFTLNRLEYLATTDSLTGLANRALFYDRLQLALDNAPRNDQMETAVMLLDLNHFKHINDALGHQVGDKVLCQVSKRFRSILRKGDSLARLGGDEFGILLPPSKDVRATVEQVAGKIQSCFQQPFLEQEHELHLGVSVGIAIAPEHGDTPDTLIRCADVAMYNSKRNKTPFQFYEPTFEAVSREQIGLGKILRHALKDDHFELHYQPQLDILSGQPLGVEALIRLNHPQQGMLAPDKFIAVAEQIGLMEEVTEWVLHRALRDIQAWGKNQDQLSMSINVSPSNFRNRGFPHLVHKALSDNGICPTRLEIEITENILMTDLDRGSRLLHELNDMGIRISIDDFGTGYSSLAYLKQLPINQLKIDKSFILDMNSSQSDAKIVRSIIDLGHNLGYHVVAEGVEDQQVLEALRKLGCDAAQGYHISRPLTQPGCCDWLNLQMTK